MSGTAFGERTGGRGRGRGRDRAVAAGPREVATPMRTKGAGDCAADPPIGEGGGGLRTMRTPRPKTEAEYLPERGLGMLSGCAAVTCYRFP